MKYFIVWLCLLTIVINGSSTTTKINHSKKDLSKTKVAKKKANRKLEQIASNIKSTEKSMKALNDKLDILENVKDKSEEEYRNLNEELSFAKEALLQTNDTLEMKNKHFMTLLSDQFSTIFAMREFKNPTQESVIAYEAYKAYKEYNTRTLTEIKSEIALLKSEQEDKQSRYKKIKKSIFTLENQRKLYAKESKKKQKLLKKMTDNEQKYQKRLQYLADKQSSLRLTLGKLKILRSHEIKKARKREIERKEAIRVENKRKQKLRKEKALALAKIKKAKKARARANNSRERMLANKAVKKAKEDIARTKKKEKIQSARIRKINSSYTKSKTYSYNGKKTISPLPGSKLVKRFGAYMDPIYKIKIFNESITLKARKSNAKVQNILNGKVVFSGKTSMLGKVVVVAHNNKMHSVYAGLSRIAPNIHVGSKIHKGYVLGRVARKLIFQATKNSKHIDPMKLIKL